MSVSKYTSPHMFTQYANCMDEIRRRTKTIGFMLEGNWPSAGPQLVAECVYLQFRKILEFISMALGKH